MNLVFRGSSPDVLRAAFLAATLTIGAALIASCSGPPPPDADFPGGPILNPVLIHSAAIAERKPISVGEVTPSAGTSGSVESTRRAAPASPSTPRRPAPDFAAALGPLTVDLAAPFVAPINDNPGRLVGLDQRAVQNLLGKPRFVRRDDPARMWRYRHASCVLDLFLYAEPGTAAKSFKVRYVEARAPGPKAASSRRCLRALLTARRSEDTG